LRATLAKPFIRRARRYHPVTNRIYSAWEFRSNQIQAITYLRRIFYPNGVAPRIIPASIKPLFTSLSLRGLRPRSLRCEQRSLAIIIMDDEPPTARDGGIRIRGETNGFSVADVKVLQSIWAPKG